MSKRHHISQISVLKPESDFANAQAEGRTQLLQEWYCVYLDAVTEEAADARDNDGHSFRPQEPYPCFVAGPACDGYPLLIVVHYDSMHVANVSREAPDLPQTVAGITAEVLAYLAKHVAMSWRAIEFADAEVGGHGA